MAMVEMPTEMTLTLKHRIRGNYKCKHMFCEAQYDNAMVEMAQYDNGYGRDA